MEHNIGYAPKVKCVPKFAAQFERDPMCNNYSRQKGGKTNKKKVAKKFHLKQSGAGATYILVKRLGSPWTPDPWGRVDPKAKVS